MRLFRALTAAIVLIVSIGLVIGESPEARAQDVGGAEEAAEVAEQAAAAAHSLLSEAATRRTGIEADLATSLARLTDLNARLTELSVDLDAVRQLVVQAEGNLRQVADALEVQAVDAYMRAIAIPATALVGTADAESAIVAASSIESAIASDQAIVAELAVARRQMQELTDTYLAQQAEVERLQEAADAEATRFEQLLAEADADLAAAVAEARAADGRHRAALDEVAAARAREAERQRQTERPTTTTVPGSPTPTPGTTTPTTTPSTAPPPPPVAGGTFPPSVERWRPIVTQYFPAERVDGALAVMKCESNGDPEAYNPYSGASGLFQFLPSTWATASPQAGFGGASPFDGVANIATAAWFTNYYATQSMNPWSAWHCQP